MMERRSLFRLGFRKAMEVMADRIPAAPPAGPATWIRPPYALAEIPFLLACDRCDACIQACPHHVLFRLGASAGSLAQGTPAMALHQSPCQMCEGWPCATACTRGALHRPEHAEDTPPLLPQMARAIIDERACLPYSGPECGACADSCPVPGALTWNHTQPIIAAPCIGCDLCRQACITDPKAITLVPLPAAAEMEGSA